MGIFSTKKKTVVNTSITRLIEDKDIPDVNKAALYDYIFHDQKNRNNTINTERALTDFIALHHANSIGNTLRSSRAWATKKYAYGVPEGDVLNSSEVNLITVMDEYLTALTGKQLRVSYALMQPLNALHFTWYLLAKEHGYNLDSNQFSNLTASIGVPVYLKDIQINYCSNTIRDLVDPEMVVQQGMPATYGKTDTRALNAKRAHTAYIENTTAEHDYALVTYSYMQGTFEKEGTFQIDFLDYEYSGADPDNEMAEDANEHIDPDAVTPIVNDNRSEKDYFMVEYYIQEGTAEKRQYFIYEFGSNGIPELDRLFITNQLMGKYYPNVYFRLMGTKLASDPYKDTDEYKSSKFYANRLGFNWAAMSDELHDSVGSVGDVSQMIMSCQLGANADDNLTQKYMYEYFYSLYKQMPNTLADSSYGNLSDQYTNGFAKAGQTIRIKDKVYANRIAFSAISYEDIKGSIGPVGTVTAEQTLQTTTAKRRAFQPPAVITIHKYSKQITEGTYRTVSVYGLSSTQEVNGGYSTTASKGDENLVIPLDEIIVNKFPIKERSLLYSKSLIFIFNTIKVIKTKWYQSGVFKAIMFVVAVVLSIWTGGQSLTLYAVAYAVVQTVVIGIVLNIVVRFLVEKMNMNIGGLFVVVAIIMIAYGGASLLTKSGSILSTTSAQFMQLANYSIQVSSIANQLTMEKMLKAQATYYDMLQDKYDAIEKIQDDLQFDPIVNPAFLLSDGIRGPDIRIETMNTFLTRTLSVDMGLATLDTIPNMVALTVRLPSFEELYAKYAEQRELTI